MYVCIYHYKFLCNALIFFFCDAFGDVFSNIIKTIERYNQRRAKEGINKSAKEGAIEDYNNDPQMVILH